MNQEIIAFLINEFKPTKKDNLIIIFTFALSVLVSFLGVIISLNTYDDMLTLLLSMSLFGIVCILILWKILRLLRESGILRLLGGYGRFNDF